MGTPEQTGPDTDLPFGHYALPLARERVRAGASRYADTRLGRWAISLRRKLAVRGLAEPFDVAVAPGVKARLYPSGNRCEKRALAGVQVWDAREREALSQAVRDGEEAFVFLDVGANAGLYSLFANAYAADAGRTIRLVAVEPNPLMAGRLAINAAASGADVEIVRVAVSDAPGEAYLSSGSGNLGEVALKAEGVRSVPVATLADLCADLGLDRIDALKLDIEGHDERALRAFFADAPEMLHPRLMILELSAESRAPLVELALGQNYVLTDDTAINAVFKKKTDHVQT
jgi:FkbM family methyltransferase